MAEVDLVVLCLPDEAAKEIGGAGRRAWRRTRRSCSMPAPRIGSTRLGLRLPGADAGQAAQIAAAHAVANPGCYPTGAIALLRPLVEAGLIPRRLPVTINAVSGYSGGGKSMIEAHDSDGGPAFELYGLGLEHKHVPETQTIRGLTRRPIFVPSVGHFRQGMLVSVPLHLDTLPGRPTRRRSAGGARGALRRLATCPGRRPTPTTGWSRKRSTIPTKWN